MKHVHTYQQTADSLAKRCSHARIMNLLGMVPESFSPQPSSIVAAAVPPDSELARSHHSLDEVSKFGGAPTESTRKLSFRAGRSATSEKLTSDLSSRKEQSEQTVRSQRKWCRFLDQAACWMSKNRSGMLYRRFFAMEPRICSSLNMWTGLKMRLLSYKLTPQNFGVILIEPTQHMRD